MCRERQKTIDLREIKKGKVVVVVVVVVVGIERRFEKEANNSSVECSLFRRLRKDSKVSNHKVQRIFEDTSNERGIRKKKKKQSQGGKETEERGSLSLSLSKERKSSPYTL